MSDLSIRAIKGIYEVKVLQMNKLKDAKHKKKKSLDVLAGI